MSTGSAYQVDQEEANKQQQKQTTQKLREQETRTTTNIFTQYIYIY